MIAVTPHHARPVSSTPPIALWVVLLVLLPFVAASALLTFPFYQGVAPGQMW